MERNYIDCETAIELRDRLVEMREADKRAGIRYSDPQDRELEISEVARRNRCFPADVERALEALPPGKPRRLSGREDLARVANLRDAFLRRGYPATAEKCSEVLDVATPILEDQERLAQAKAMLRDWKRKRPELPEVSTEELFRDARAAGREARESLTTFCDTLSAVRG